MAETDDEAAKALSVIARVVGATAAFEDAGVPRRIADVLIYELKISSLAEMRTIPWDDADGEPGLRSRLLAAWRCGPRTTAAIRELHAGRSGNDGRGREP
jgi:hypothetical protein